MAAGPDAMNVLMVESTNYRGETRVGSHAYGAQFRQRGDDVMWIGTPLYLHSFLSPSDETARRIEVWRRGGVLSGDGVREYYPLTLLPVVDRPLLRTRFAVENTLRWTTPLVERVVRRHGFANPDLLWLSQSRISPAILPLIRARQVAYRLSDDWQYFRNVPSALVRAEDEVIRRADAVFATSRILVDRVRALRDDVVYLPNGVDASFFAPPPAAEPLALRDIPRPRVVFVGSLSHWVDFDTITAVAQRCLEATVVLVGPGSPPPGALPARVRNLGPQPFADIPAILHHCDAAMIPFTPGPLTNAVSPVKLFEYLATGIPVVATRLSEIESTGSPAILARSGGEFAAAVAGVLDGSIVWPRDDAIAFAEQHTWSRRFATVLDTLGRRTGA